MLVIISVRRALAADWNDARQIRLHALRDTPAAFASTYEQEAVLGRTEWQQRLAESAQFLAEHEGEVVGTATGIVDNSDPDTTHLVAMYVVPLWRGNGIGKQLVMAVVDQARNSGSRRVQLQVVDSNTDGWRLYTRLGFTESDTPSPITDRSGSTLREMILLLRG